jgi:hypothetical protein
MIILVADTSVLIDLERGQLLEVALSGTDTIATPDFLYDKELAQDIGPQLMQLGLQILNLDPRELGDTQALFQTTQGALSLPDCAAYVAARRTDHHLLSGDGALRKHADDTGVPCNGVLWLLDRLLSTGATTDAILHAGLSRIVAHARCRLPKAETNRRLRDWSK